MCAWILALLEAEENSSQVAACLRKAGHQVVLAQTFKAAISLLRAQPRFELIISDVHLENGGNVFDFLRWVTSNASKVGNVPFVLYSFRPSPAAKYLEDAVRTAARVFGAAKYIAMDSFNPEEFLRVINSLIPATQPIIVEESDRDR
jgi:CheY-like chemotaxis protein